VEYQTARFIYCGNSDLFHFVCELRSASNHWQCPTGIVLVSQLFTVLLEVGGTSVSSVLGSSRLCGSSSVSGEAEGAAEKRKHFPPFAWCGHLTSSNLTQRKLIEEMLEGSLHLLSGPHDYMCNCSLADGALDCGMTQRLPWGFCFSLVRACAWHGAPDSPDNSPHLTFVLPQEY